MEVCSNEEDSDGQIAILHFSSPPNVHEEGNMDHHEAVRKFEHLMLKEADQAYEAATELEALVSHLPNEKSRQLAQIQANVSHQQAKDFRELAQKVKER